MRLCSDVSSGYRLVCYLTIRWTLTGVGCGFIKDERDCHRETQQIVHLRLLSLPRVEAHHTVFARIRRNLIVGCEATSARKIGATVSLFCSEGDPVPVVVVIVLFLIDHLYTKGTL